MKLKYETTLKEKFDHNLNSKIVEIDESQFNII